MYLPCHTYICGTHVSECSALPSQQTSVIQIDTHSDMVQARFLQAPTSVSLACYQLELAAGCGKRGRVWDALPWHALDVAHLSLCSVLFLWCWCWRRWGTFGTCPHRLAAPALCRCVAEPARH